MAESTIGLFKTELHRNPATLAANGGPWRGLDDLEIATCAWVSWFNTERLHSELQDRTPAEIEDAHYRDLAAPARHEDQPRESPSDPGRFNLRAEVPFCSSGSRAHLTNRSGIIEHILRRRWTSPR